LKVSFDWEIEFIDIEDGASCFARYISSSLET